MRHLVVIPTVPVVFPKLPFSESALSTINSSGLVKGMLQKTGLADGIMDRCLLATMEENLSVVSTQNRWQPASTPMCLYAQEEKQCAATKLKCGLGSRQSRHVLYA